MVSKAKVAGAIIGAGVGIGVLYYLIKRAAAAPTKLLTFSIVQDSTPINECASGSAIKFMGRYTEAGSGVDGVRIYAKNEDTGDRAGPGTTASGGYYSIDSTCPTVSAETTYHYRAYTEDQIS
jgi:hypothetical protein